MDYIVLDLEWNQSPTGRPPKNAPVFEIVEIGAVRLNDRGEQVDTFHSYVYPKIFKTMHYMTREVTGIDNKLLRREGVKFPLVMEDFFKFCGDDYCFCTWGDMDLTHLQINCDYYKIRGKFPFPLLFLDVQKLYSLQYEDGKDRTNLKNAVEELNIPKIEGSHFHSAFTDAKYTAEVLKRIDLEQFGKYVSVDYHKVPADKEHEIYLNFGTYTKYISREFKNKEDAMEDRIVVSCTCYACGRALRKKIRWFSLNGKQFYSLCQCPEHGYLKGKIRFKKGPGGGFFAVKTQKLVGEDVADAIRLKQKQTQKKQSARAKEK